MRRGRRPRRRQAAELDVLDAGAVLAEPPAAEGLEGGLGDGAPHEIEHQTGRVTVQSIGEGFSVGVPVAGEGHGLRTCRGGASQARSAPSGADSAGRAIRQGFTLQDAVRGLVLLRDFTIGFCVEEQAVVQVTLLATTAIPLTAGPN